jgi:hypothetical protein
MSNWEYAVEIIKLEYGDSEGWSVQNSPYGHIKLANDLNEFGKWRWELVSAMPVLSEQGAPVLPPTLCVIFKRPSEPVTQREGHEQ